MNDVIEIKEPFDKYATYTKNILSKISDSEERMKTVDGKLLETDKWSGESHDQCVNALALLQGYTKPIKDMILELESCLKNMDSSASQFESGSRNVQDWKAW